MVKARQQSDGAVQSKAATSQPGQAPDAAQKANPVAPAKECQPQGQSIVADVQALVRLTKRLGVGVASRVIEDVENKRV